MARALVGGAWYAKLPESIERSQRPRSAMLLRRLCRVCVYTSARAARMRSRHVWPRSRRAARRERLQMNVNPRKVNVCRVRVLPARGLNQHSKSNSKGTSLPWPNRGHFYFGSTCDDMRDGNETRQRCVSAASNPCSTIVTSRSASLRHTASFTPRSGPSSISMAMP